MFSLSSTFSVAASTTKSAPTHHLYISVSNYICYVLAFIFRGDRSFGTILSKLAAIVAIPFIMISQKHQLILR
jgi:hypothetical protein